MKHLILIVALLFCISIAWTNVLFYDNFNRTEASAVGNGWTNIGPVNPIVEAGAMKITSASLQGVRRDFTTLGITSGIYYVSYDWKITSNDWLADAFPNGVVTYLRHDYEGNLYYDNSSDFSTAVDIGNLALSTWANIKLKVNLDTDRFSLWINNLLVADNIAGLSVSDFTRFTFRAGSGSNVTQYVDNFIVYNDVAPATPTALTATGTVNNIALSWTGTAADFLTYKIYRSTTSPATTLLAEVPATQTSYTNNTAAANTDYFYRVKAVSMSTIESGFSNEVTAHLQPDIAVTPLGITTTLNLAHNISLHSFSISNTGNYNLSYELSGTDTYAANPSLPAISGFTAMGIFNGHRYYRSNRTMTWTAAKTLCERSGGHLATITSAEENTFLSSSTRMWIGLTDEVTEGTYRWVTNEPYSYYNWATNQPDNSSGIEDYVEINFSGFLGTWNDNTNGTNLNAILEIETLPITSILSFTPSSGMIETTATQAIAMAINGAYLADGVYQTSVKITSDAPEPRDTIYIPVTVKVDYTPPTAPLGLVFDEAQSDMNQIYLSWTANTMADSVYSYKIFRRGVHDADWTLKGTVDADQLWFIDNQFTGLDTTAVYYKITAVDWVDNEGSASSEVLAWLQRFAAPTGLNISTLLGRHIHLQWSPVTQTISGAPGTPTCYLIYKSSTPLPLSEYDFLDIAETTEYTHRYATFFQPGNKLFYILTAYGGDVPGLRRMLANRRECKYGELEKILPETKR